MNSISDTSPEQPTTPGEDRIQSLVATMTLDEKIECLSTRPKLERLGIEFSGHVEGLHGLALGGPGKWGGDDPITTTTFPQAIGLAQSWNPDLIQRIAEVEATEARYAFHHLGRGGLVVRAPNADLARDPRWGRTEESFGEDPHLVGTLSAAFVRGLQGSDAACFKAAALLKHFLANSTEDGRLDTSAEIDEKMLREYYAWPFEHAVRAAGATCFMAAYNAVNSVPCTVHELLGVTRREWGVDGIICTDAFALEMLKTKHHYFDDLEVAAAACIKAGITQFLDDYEGSVRGALERQLVTEKEIEGAVVYNLRTMSRLGLLDPQPSFSHATFDASRGEPWTWEEHRALARRAASESIVLLKNEGQLLPLDEKEIRTIAVIGPYADRVLHDWYSGTPPYSISPLDGIKERFGDGVEILTSLSNDTSQAIYVAKRADVCIVCVGNQPTGDAGWGEVTRASYGKEEVDRKSLTLEDEKIVEEVYSANPKTVLILHSSFPYAIQWSQDNVPAILHVPHSGQELGRGLAAVLSGDAGPGGRLVMTWPKSIDDLPPMMDFDLRSGRTYMYSDKEPLYPFGYGLTYTTFSYGAIELSSSELSPSAPLHVAIDVTNTGERAGDAVVQMYVSRPGSQRFEAKKVLRGFTRVAVARGATERVEFVLRATDLHHWDVEDGGWQLERGEVTVLLGTSAADVIAEKAISVI